MKRFLKLSVIFLLIAAFSCFAFADEEDGPEITLKAEGFDKNNVFTDSKWSTYASAKAENSVTISCDEGLLSIYIEFDRIPQQTWTLTDTSTGKSAVCGSDGFLHEYQNLEEIFGSSPKEVRLAFAEGTIISNIYAYSSTEPENIQKWQPCYEQADLMLITTHSDDEQLFFAGLLPYYAIERKLNVQVVYFVQHFHKANKVFEHTRPHEQLNGLWTVGITHYPYMSEFPDAYGEGETSKEAMDAVLRSFRYYGYKYDDFQRFVVDTIRKFKPLVVVTHDLDGEYGHGAHILNADVTTKAMDLCGDPEKYPESAAQYGTWVPEKLYVHMYKKNQIVMDWDTPYESMGGKTPLQMTQAGFECHSSQHRYWFYTWLNGYRSNPITKATQIKKYSPCNYGLYFTTVGEDVAKNDMFENVKTYGQQQAEKEAEEARKKAEQEAEEARKRAEEEAEAARKKAEEEAAEAARIAAEREHRKNVIMIALAAVALIAGILILVFTRRSVKKR